MACIFFILILLLRCNMEGKDRLGVWEDNKDLWHSTGTLVNIL